MPLTSKNWQLTILPRLAIIDALIRDAIGAEKKIKIYPMENCNETD